MFWLYDPDSAVCIASESGAPLKSAAACLWITMNPDDTRVQRARSYMAVQKSLEYARSPCPVCGDRGCRASHAKPLPEGWITTEETP